MIKSHISDGQLYTATVADFSGTDPLIYREPLRTERSDLKQLNGNYFDPFKLSCKHVHEVESFRCSRHNGLMAVFSLKIMSCNKTFQKTITHNYLFVLKNLISCSHSDACGINIMSIIYLCQDE